MGISIGGAKLLLAEAARRPFQGRVLTLGKQDVHVTTGILEQIASEAGVRLGRVTPVTYAQKPLLHGNLGDRCISDRFFFQSLGFSEVASLDNSDYEGADYVFDLNRADLPEVLLERFDVIYDGGTIEHIFHVPNVLNNIFRMLAGGGRVIHHAPSSNYMDHGFYMFSPTLFWDFYAANDFDINDIKVIRHTPAYNTDPWEISDYTPHCLDPVSFGGLDDGLYAINCVATKTPGATGSRIPQQRFFTRLWQPKKADLSQTAPSAQTEQVSRPLAIRVAKAVLPSGVRRFLRSTARLLTKPKSNDVARKAKGLRLPVVKYRTHYE